MCDFSRRWALEMRADAQAKESWRQGRAVHAAMAYWRLFRRRLTLGSGYDYHQMLLGGPTGLPAVPAQLHVAIAHVVVPRLFTAEQRVNSNIAPPRTA